jgi:hypothetical protein
MPLNTVPDPFELSSYQGINENFVIFYSSRDEESGRMWCPVRLFPRSKLAETLPRRPLGPPSKRLDLCFQICIRIHSFACHICSSLRRHQDCRDVEDIIARTFAPPDGPSGLIIYVGQKAECVLFCLPPVGPFDHLSPTPDLEPVVESKKLKIVPSAAGERRPAPFCM